MADSKEKRLPRRDKRETKELLLEAGQSLLDEYQGLVDDRMLGDALRHIRLNAVLDRATAIEAERTGISNPAPITTGAVYHAFPEGELEYRAALLRHVLSAERTANPHVLVDEVGRIMEEHDGVLPDDLEELIRRLAGVRHVHDREVPAVFTRVGFFAFVGHPEVSDLLAKNYREVINDYGVADFYEMMLGLTNRRWKEPITTQLFATLVLGLLEGLNLRWRVDREAVPDDIGWKGEGQWTLFAIGVEALVNQLSEPTDSNREQNPTTPP